MASEMGFGILGSGNMARVYGDALTREGIVPRGRLAAIALGSRAESLAAEYPGVAVEASAEALLARKDIDTVVVATPHSTHLPLARAVAAAGKHVYLEKPMALDVAECDAIIDACRQAGVQLTIAKQTRHMEMSMRAKEHIDQGRIGDILFLRPMAVTPGAGFDNVPQSWPSDPREGDAFLDWGSHACDATRWFTGADAVRVYADFDNFTGQPGGAGSHRARPDPPLDRGDRPDPALLRDRAVGLRDAPKQPVPHRRHEGLRVLGPRSLRALDRRPRPDDLGAAVLDAAGLQAARPAPIGNTSRQIVDFIEDVGSGRAPRITGADGRDAIEMTQAARLSAKTGRAIDLPLKVGAPA